MRSRSRMVWVMPLRNSWRPVSKAERVGEQVGLLNQLVNRKLCPYSLSMFGVLRMGLPWAETSP